MENNISQINKNFLRSFLIAGVGASAGGLEAITELFQSIPPDSGIAFLLVQHLDPDHSSMLTEILGRAAAISVTEAADGEAIEPNHIYVIPPNAIMTIKHNRLSLKQRNDIAGRPRQIDELLCSLAADQGENAIGVILSGAGSDGADGMQAIRSAGGLTFAQDETARFSDMPQAAIALSAVNFIGAPKEIAEEMVRASQQPRGEAPPPGMDAATLDEDSLKRLFRFLNRTCNIDFSHYKRSTINRRLARGLPCTKWKNCPLISPWWRIIPARRRRCARTC